MPVNKVTVVADLNWGDHTNNVFYQSRDRVMVKMRMRMVMNGIILSSSSS